MCVCIQIIKVYSEDGAGNVVEVPADMRARDVCQFLVYRSHCLDDNSWSLVEHHPLLGLGVCLCVGLSGVCVCASSVLRLGKILAT